MEKNRENMIFDIANRVYTCSKISGISPKTVWDNYISEDIKTELKWSEVKKYLNL